MYLYLTQLIWYAYNLRIIFLRSRPTLTCVTVAWPRLALFTRATGGILILHFKPVLIMVKRHTCTVKRCDHRMDMVMQSTVLVFDIFPFSLYRNTRVNVRPISSWRCERRLNTSMTSIRVVLFSIWATEIAMYDIDISNIIEYFKQHPF